MLNELSEVNMMNVLDHQFDENWWMEYRAGNILDQTDLDYVIHQCNCFHCMGGGVAYALVNRWPEVAEIDVTKTKYADENKMGSYTKAKVKQQYQHNGKSYERDIYVVNIYSQYEPGAAINNEEISWSMLCLKTALNNLRDEILERTRTNIIKNRKFYIGVPWMIGCGIYGMKVNEIYELIRDVFYDYADYIKIIFVDYNA